MLTLLEKGKYILNVYTVICSWLADHYKQQGNISSRFSGSSEAFLKKCFLRTLSKLLSIVLLYASKIDEWDKYLRRRASKLFPWELVDTEL